MSPKHLLVGLGASARDFGVGVPHRHVAYFDPALLDRVPNPGMGLVGYAYSDHMYVQSGHGTQPLSMTQELVEELARSPYCDVLYVRVEWRDVQTRAGELRLPPLFDWVRESAERHHKRWAMRIMPISPQSRYPRSTPEFLDDKLSFSPYPERAFGPPFTKFFPVYDDRYVGCWRELMFLLAERFDADPGLDFVDISGFGKWGEWHHWPELDFEQSAFEPLACRIAEAHLEAFRSTPAIAVMTPGAAWKDELLGVLLERGAGVRRDSFSPLFTPWELAITRRVTEAGRPFVVESGFFPDTIWSPAGSPRLTYPEAFQRMLDLGATHVNLGFNCWHLRETGERHGDDLRSIKARLGYRLRPSIVWLTQGMQGGKRRLSLAVTNDGSTPPSGTVIVRVDFGDRWFSVEQELRPGTPAPHRAELVEFELPESCQPDASGSFRFELRASIRSGAKVLPLRWATASAQASPDRFVLPIVVTAVNV